MSNPLPNLSGGYLKVSIDWNQIDTSVPIEKPELLQKFLSDVLGTELLSKPTRFGMIAIKEKIGTAVYVHFVSVIILQ